MGKGGGCGASGNPTLPSGDGDIQFRAVQYAPAATAAHAKAVAAVERLLASMQATGAQVDVNAVLSHVESAQAAVTAGAPAAAAPAAAPVEHGGAFSSEQIRSFAHELQRTAINSHGRTNSAEAFIERFAVGRILRGATFVGHINTDLDSIAGAIGAANLYDGTAAKAQKELNGEITYALEFAGLPEPTLFDDLGEEARSRVCLVDHNEEKQVSQSTCKHPAAETGLHGSTGVSHS